jgi:hypothetical protein
MITDLVPMIMPPALRPHTFLVWASIIRRRVPIIRSPWVAIMRTSGP